MHTLGKTPCKSFTPLEGGEGGKREGVLSRRVYNRASTVLRSIHTIVPHKPLCESEDTALFTSEGAGNNKEYF